MPAALGPAGHQAGASRRNTPTYAGAAFARAAGGAIRRYGWVAVLAAVAVGSWFALSKAGEDRTRSATAPDTVPDFVARGFVTTALDATGAPSHELAARRLEHFPGSGHSELETPTLLLLATDSEGGPPWHAWAERGWLSPDGDELRLQGEVRLWRYDAAGSPAALVETRDFTVFPAAGYGESDAPARLLGRHAETLGTGLRASLADGRLELARDVTTRYRRELLAEPLRAGVADAAAARAAVIQQQDAAGVRREVVEQ